MRLFVLFDLPTLTDREKNIYRKFRSFLLDDGYIMIQYSIYIRICRNQDDLNKHINRIKSNLPEKGDVRILQITENQFEKMQILRGTKKPEEDFSVKSLLIFD